jgi:hypothetical protein
MWMLCTLSPVCVCPLSPRLAVERELVVRSNRVTGDVRAIRVQPVVAKVLEYRSFLEYLTILKEDELGLKKWDEVRPLTF